MGNITFWVRTSIDVFRRPFWVPETYETRGRTLLKERSARRKDLYRHRTTQCGSGTGFSPSSSVFPCQYISFHSSSRKSHHLGDEQYVRQWQQFRDVVLAHKAQSVNPLNAAKNILTIQVITLTGL
jgi:hypothetical protein